MLITSVHIHKNNTAMHINAVLLDHVYKMFQGQQDVHFCATACCGTNLQLQFQSV